MPTPSLIIPSAPVYDEGNLYGLNVYGTQFFPEPIPFTRATTATRTNAAGLIELVPYNLVQRSEEFNVSPWGNQGTPIITANVEAAPNGTLTADSIENSNSSNFVRQSVSLNIGTTYNASFYIKNSKGGRGH